MTTIEPPPANPFLAALSEGAASTYLSMLNAGLAERFDPLPRSASGLGLVGSLLARPSPTHGPQLCAAMAALGLDPTDEQEMPIQHHHIAWHWTRNQLERESAPLAALAIAARSECYAPLWQTLSHAQLRKIGSTALPLALLSENLAALDALLAAGVNPSAPDAAGLPPAARCQSPEALQKMVDCGADLRAPLPDRIPYTGCATLLDWMLAKTGRAAAATGMRDISIAWAKAHPPLDDPLADLASSAFKALREGNKNSARRCVLAMGARAPQRRDESGESLALAAARHENYPELSRLLDLGADPFEVSPAGESAWATMLSHRWPSTNVRASWRSAHENRSLDRLLSHLSTKRKYKPIPWTRLNARGIGLLETLVANAPLPEFLAHAQSAFALGVDPRAPLSSGMDLPCDLALRLQRATHWVEGDLHGRLVKDFLAKLPIEDSSLSSKAALARHFWAAALEPRATLLREAGSRPAPCLEGRDEPFLLVLLDGFCQLGRDGAAAPDFDELGYRAKASLDPSAPALVLSCHQRGVLESTAAPASKPSVGPKRM